MRIFGTVITVVLGLGVCALIGIQLLGHIRMLPPVPDKPEPPEFVWCVEVDGVAYQSRRKPKVYDNGVVEFWPQGLDGRFVRSLSRSARRWSAPATVGCNLDWMGG